MGLASCSFEGRTGEKLEKEVEREVGTLGAGLPDALRLTWWVGLRLRIHYAGGFFYQWWAARRGHLVL